jgi:hypothetical protein
MSRRSPISFVALGALLLSTDGWAGANHVPEWSLATDQDAAKAVETFGFSTDGKATTWPKKIAIGAFVVRYDKVQYDRDRETYITLKFPEADYVALTDALYEALVQRFTAAGFEVVPREAVVRSAAYGALAGEPGTDEGSERVRAVPTGMKDLGTKLGQPSHPDALAGLNRDLGTDAVVAVYANFGLCTVDYTLDTRMSGTKPCLRGNLTLPGLSMLFVGGSQGEGAAVKPQWTSRVYKRLVEFTYQRTMALGSTPQVAEVYDAALISPLDAVDWDPSRDTFWSNRSGGADAAAYAQGVADMLDVAFTLSMDTFYDRNAAAMAAAKFPRPARKPPNESAKTLTAAQVEAKAAANQAKLDGARAALAARPDGAPQVAGTVACYHAPAAGTQPEVVMRRGFEPGRMVEESVSVIPNVGPSQSGAVYQLSATGYDVADTKGIWTGTGTFEGTADGWRSWRSAIQVKTGATVAVTGSAEGTGLHVVTVVKGADGAVAGNYDVHYSALDATACAAAWDKALAYRVPAAVPAGAKPKKGK